MSNEPRQLLGPLSQSVLRDCWRDRTAGWPLSELQRAVVGMSRPPWWRLVARWRWRKLARSLAKPQPGPAGWKVIDCRNAPGHLSDVVFEPEPIELTAFTPKDLCSTTVGARYKWDKVAGAAPFVVLAALLGFSVWNFVSTADSDPAVREFAERGFDWGTFKEIWSK